MGFLGQTFEQKDMPKNTSFEPIPAGWYRVTITAAELKDSQKGGKYANIRYDVTGPTHEGRVIFGMVTIQNSSQKAEEIGRAQLGELMGAVGVARLSDTDQLIGKHCEIKVSIRKDGQYGDKNDVRTWRAIEGAQLPKPQENKMQKPAGGGAPW